MERTTGPQSRPILLSVQGTEFVLGSLQGPGELRAEVGLFFRLAGRPSRPGRCRGTIIEFALRFG
jgi:hypothetical protein